MGIAGRTLARATVFIVGVAVGFGGWRGEAVQPSGEPKFTSVIVTDDKVRRIAKTVFAPDTPQVYAIFVVSDVPPGTPIKAIWIAERSTVAPDNYKIDQASMTLGGNLRSGTFALISPTSGWPVGRYRVELHIGDLIRHVGRFRVANPARSSSSTIALAGSASPSVASLATLGDIIFASDVERERPVGVTDIFAPSVQRIYAFFPFRDLQPDHMMTGLWFKNGTEVLRYSTILAAISRPDAAPSGNMWFWLNWIGGVPPGSYRFEVHLNGRPMRSRTFEVRP